MILTYGRVLSAIEKALWELMEEYQEVRRSLQDLVEDQERIEAAMGQRWSSEGENRKEESRDNEERSKNSFRESQEEKTPLSASC